MMNYSDYYRAPMGPRSPQLAKRPKLPYGYGAFGGGLQEDVGPHQSFQQSGYGQQHQAPQLPYSPLMSAGGIGMQGGQSGQPYGMPSQYHPGSSPYGMGGQAGYQLPYQAPQAGLGFDQYQQQFSRGRYSDYLKYLVKNPGSQQTNRVGY